MKQLRLCIFGHSGSGKSTTAGYFLETLQEKGYRVDTIKLAEPLYQLQKKIYAAAGRSIDHYAQDQQVLEWLAQQLRKINPASLVEDFEKRLKLSQANVILNDDLRDKEVDYLYLKKMGFIFIRMKVKKQVAYKRLQKRHDLNTVFRSSASRDIDVMTSDIDIENNGASLNDLKRKLDDTLTSLITKTFDNLD